MTKAKLNIIVPVTLLFFYIFLTAGMISCQNKRDSTSKNSNQASTIEMAIPENLNWSERMAQSVMKRHPESWQIDDKEALSWDYVHGLVLMSFEKLYEDTGKDEYFDYVKSYADALIDSTGNIKTYEMEKYNIDMINAGKILFYLDENTEDIRYRLAMDQLRQQLADQPRNASGGFWHKKIYPNQMWLDGLYMGAPFYIQYTQTFENGEQIDDITKQFELIQANARDEETGLLYHGWDESKAMDWANPKTGTSPNFWSRSLGWYAMALVDVLDYMPKDHSGRDKLINYLNQLATAIANFQDESGLWYQVTDQGDRDGNYLEASGSAMFTYALAKAVNQGYIPASYREVAQRAFDGMISQLIKTDPDGEIHITQVCAVAGLGGNPYRDGTFEYYVNERKKDNDPKATGPFILAALELDQ